MQRVEIDNGRVGYVIEKPEGYVLREGLIVKIRLDDNTTMLGWINKIL